MEGYLVEFYLKDKKVNETICKSSNKSNAISNATKKSDVDNFDTIKVHKVKLSYEIIEEV